MRSALLPCEDRRQHEAGTRYMGASLESMRGSTPCNGQWTRHVHARDVTKGSGTARSTYHVYACTVCGHERTWGCTGYGYRAGDEDQGAVELEAVA